MKVIVGQGESQQSHHLHSSLLSANSEFFRGCLSSGFSESAKGEISLPEEDPKVFQYFVKWIYAGDLLPFLGIKQYQVINILIDLRALAGRMLVPDLKNRAMDLIQEYHTKRQIVVRDVLKAGRMADEDVKLEGYMLEQLIRDMDNGSHDTFMSADSWPELFVADSDFTSQLIRGLTKRTVKKDPSAEEGCQWHEHPGPRRSEPCKRLRRSYNLGTID